MHFSLLQLFKCECSTPHISFSPHHLKHWLIKDGEDIIGLYLVGEHNAAEGEEYYPPGFDLLVSM